MEEKGSRIRVWEQEEDEEEEARRRICRPRTCHPADFGGSWAFLVPRWKPNRGFEVRNSAGALRTPTPTVLSTHLVQGRNAHSDAQAKNALTSIPSPPPDLSFLLFPPSPPFPPFPPFPPSLAVRLFNHPRLLVLILTNSLHTRLVPDHTDCPILTSRFFHLDIAYDNVMREKYLDEFKYAFKLCV